MTRDEIISRVNAILADEFELEEEALGPEAVIRELGLDSLDYFDMIIVLENEFSFKLKDKSVMEKIATMNDIYDLIEDLAEKHEGAG